MFCTVLKVEYVKLYTDRLKWLPQSKLTIFGSVVSPPTPSYPDQKLFRVARFRTLNDTEL